MISECKDRDECGLPSERWCELHETKAKLLGRDGDGVGLYDCPIGHLLDQFGEVIHVGNK